MTPDSFLRDAHRAGGLLRRVASLLLVLAIAGCAPGALLSGGDFGDAEICRGEPKDVARIALSPDSLVLTPFEVTGVEVTVFGRNGAPYIICPPPVLWTVDSADVAVLQVESVRFSRIIARRTGSARMIARIGSVADTLSVTVKAFTMAGLRINTPPSTLLAGSMQLLTASAFDEKGLLIRTPPISWTSSDERIAVVSSDGVLSMRDTGTVEIRATARIPDTTFTASATIRSVVGVPSIPVRTLSAGWYHTCALAATGSTTVAEGTAYCWGNGQVGVLGTGSGDPRLRPTPVVTNQRFRAIAAGDLFTCAIALDGSPWCWGDGTSGQLGPANTNFSTVPIRVTSTQPFAAVAVAPRLACALTTASTVWCWGWAKNHIVSTPRTVASTTTYRDLSQGSNGMCARVVATNTLHCWDSSVEWDRDAFAPSAAPVMYVDRFTSTLHTCGLVADGSAWCHGQLNGTLGPDIGTITSTSGTPVPGRLRFTRFVTAVRFACGITTALTTACIGSSGLVLTQGTTAEPQPLPGVHTPAMTTLVAGLGHICGVDGQGAVWCWGEGTSGQLGAGVAVARAAAPIRLQFEVP